MAAKRRIASAAKGASEVAQPRKQFPTAEKITFLVAEDIRPEVGNKLSLLGFLAGDIYIDPEARKKAAKDGKKIAIPIAIVFSIGDGNGVFDIRVGLVAPNGQEMWASKKPTPAKLTPGLTRTIALKLLSMEAIDGTYSAQLRVDGKVYTRTFNIKTGVPPQA